MTYHNIRWNTDKRVETALALTFTAQGSNKTVAIHPKNHNLRLR